MSHIVAFAGLRYSATADLAAVVCPPYDVVTAAEADRLRALSPHNAIHVELPTDSPGEPNSRYRVAAERLRAWLATGVLRPDDVPTFTLHETRFVFRGTAWRRRDLVAAAPVEPWSARAVLPHERTFGGPKADRLALLEATQANVSPIWLLHREPVAALDRAWAAADGAAPTADFRLPDGEQHRLWVVRDSSAVADLADGFAGGVAHLYLADGHHRYETALAYRERSGGTVPGAATALAVLTPADDPGLRVLPTHRLLRHLPAAATPARLAERLAEQFDIEALPVSSEPSRAEVDGLVARLAEAGRLGLAFGAYGAGATGVFTLATRRPAAPDPGLPRDRSAAWRSLDVALLHALVVDPLVAAAARPADQVLGYTRDAREALVEVQAGRASLALLVNPTPVGQVLAVADAADRMPEKSTYFYPKPPTGLVLRSLALA